MKTSFSVSLRLDSAGNPSVFMLPPIPRIICHLQSKGFLKVNLQPLPLSLSLSIPLTLRGSDRCSIDQLSLSLANQTNHPNTSSTLSHTVKLNNTHTCSVTHTSSCIQGYSSAFFFFTSSVRALKSQKCLFNIKCEV